MKIISKRNPVVFLNNIFKNFESVPINRYFIVDEITGELWTRNPQLVKTGEKLPSLVESELVYENDNFRLRTVEEIRLEKDNKINESFYNFKHHIEIYDLTLLCLLVPKLVSRIEELKTADGSLTRYISEQIQDPVTKKFVTVVNLFIDNKEIEEIEKLMTLTTTDFDGNIKNLVTIHQDNPVWHLFNQIT